MCEGCEGVQGVNDDTVARPWILLSFFTALSQLPQNPFLDFANSSFQNPSLTSVVGRSGGGYCYDDDDDYYYYFYFYCC